jgi:endonuclease/exonuclease/phosphatase family metal-dependent hydrolase
MLFSVLDMLIYIRPQPFKLSLASVLDYIFVDRRLQVVDCRRVFDHPAPSHPGLYASDHYGLLATIETR